MTDVYGAGRPEPWQVTDAPADDIDQLLGAVVGIEIPVERLEGKLKASQDEDLPDRVGTIAGVQPLDSDQARAMMVLVGHTIAKT